MILKLYVYGKNFKIINKNVETFLISSYDFEFKNYYNLINPSVIIDVKDEYDVKVAPSNYCKLEELNRYYFIKNRTFLSKNLVQLDLEEDVLTTFKTDILNSTQFISRTTNGNVLIEDNKLPLSYKRTISEGELQSSANQFLTEYQDLNNNIAITIVNPQLSSFLNYELNYPSDTFLLPTVSRTLIDNNYSTVTYITNEDELLKFMQFINTNSDSQQYVYKIQAFPFNIPNRQNNVKIMVGGNDSGAKGNTMHNASIAYEFSLFITYPFKRDYFYNYHPYTSYELYVPYYTWVNLSNNDSISNKIMIKYSPNLLDGSCLLTMYYVDDELNYNYFKNATIQVGISIPINVNNYSDVVRNNQAITLNLLTSFITSMASGNPLGLINAGIGSYVSSVNNVIRGQTSSVSGGNLIFTPNVCRYKITEPIITCDYDTYKNKNGIPFNNYGTIGSFQKYVEVVNPYLEHIKVFIGEGYQTATKDEIDMIKELLVNGVYVNE